MSDEVPSWARLLCAALLYSHKVARDPKEACEITQKLVAHLDYQPELEVWMRRHLRIEKSWNEGIKLITGETRLRRAQTKFSNWFARMGWRSVRNSINHPLHRFVHLYRGLADWQAKGFTLQELKFLKENFTWTQKITCQPFPAAKAKKPRLATKKPARATKKPG
jgi:hypothetical protein